MRLLGLLAIVLTILGSTSARAEDTDIVIVGWFDHFTYGLINTLVGVPVGLTGMVVNAITRGETPTFSLDSTGQQIKISSSNLNGFDYSTGAFHHGDCCDAHEAGHGKESGVLGPAYLPMVGITYLVQGLDEGIMEDWANAWRDLGSTLANNHPAQIDFNVQDYNGHVAGRIGFHYVVLERDSRVNVGWRALDNNPTQVSYKYGRIGVYILVPTASGQGDVASNPDTSDTIFPARIEGSGFEKSFKARYDVVGGIFSILSESEERTAGVDIDLTDRQMQATILSQTLGYGVRVGDERKIAVDAIGRAGISVEGLWFLNMRTDGAPSPGMMLTASLGAELRLHLFQYLEIFARKTRQWSLVGSSFRRDVDTIGAESPLFRAGDFTYHDENGNPRAMPIKYYGGLKLEHEIDRFGDADNYKSDIKSMFFTFGGRF